MWQNRNDLNLDDTPNNFSSILAGSLYMKLGSSPAPKVFTILLLFMAQASLREAKDKRVSAYKCIVYISTHIY